MTYELPEKAGPGDSHPSEDLLSAYVAGPVDEAVAWAVDAHVTGCADCRLVLSAHVDPARLARNRSVVLVRAASGEHHHALRLLSRAGVPDHLLALMAATPSLRRSWLLSIVGVLAAVSGESVLAQHLAAGPVAIGGPSWAVLAPFVLVGPLLVLAGVAAAFLPVFDPAYELALAAPFPGLGLLLARSLSALVVALIPVTAAAFVVPGPGWLPAALLLPCLALCCLALAGVTLIGPVPAAVLCGAVWVLAVSVMSVWLSVAAVVQWQAQLSWAAVLLVAVTVVALRRGRFELGWKP